MISEGHSGILEKLYDSLRSVEDSGLEEASSVKLEIPISFQEYDLRQLCPCCFHIKRGSGAIFITIDGNFSLNRFENASSNECETVNPRLFVNFGRKEYELAGDKEWEKDTATFKTNPGPCGKQFLAGKADTLSKGNAVPTKKAKRNLDETGVMVATCRHGIGIRLLNIHDSGERHSHGISLLKSINEEIGPEKLNLCYDIACRFENAIQRRIPSCVARIGQFHIYGHEGRCLSLYSSLRTHGYGLFVGEEPEQFWFQASHLVRPGKISSSARKGISLDLWSRGNAHRQRENLGTTMNRKWKKMKEVLEKYDKIYKENTRPIVGENIPNYLKTQMEKQKVFYANQR